MGKIFCVLFLLPFIVFAQSGTEIYLFDLSITKKVITVSNPVNVSNKAGYDNQPSFLQDGKTVLFTYTVQGQTEIAKYDILKKQLTVLTQTSGSEYSPLQTPDPGYFSAILLEKDGTQLLNRYPIEDSRPTVLIPDVIVGYHTWENAESLFAFVLGTPNTLQHIRLKNGIDLKHIAVNPGRSLHFHQTSRQLYFVDKSEAQPLIKSYSPETEKFITIAPVLDTAEDFAVIDQKSLIMGTGSQLFFFDGLKKQPQWELISDLASFGLNGISRLAVSPDQKYLAVVVAE
jgi:hypothetical protein